MSSEIEGQAIIEVTEEVTIIETSADINSPIYAEAAKASAAEAKASEVSAAEDAAATAADRVQTGLDRQAASQSASDALASEQAAKASENAADEDAQATADDRTYIDGQVDHVDSQVAHVDSQVDHVDSQVTFVDQRATDADASATAAAASETAAAGSAASADADATQTADDRRQTGEDRVQTGLDRAAASDSQAAAKASEDAAAASEAATAQDAQATADDRVATNADAQATAADRVATGEDAAATAADRVQTGLDRQAAEDSAEAADLDAQATAADRVQTGLDRTAASDSATAAADSAALADQYRQAASDSKDAAAASESSASADASAAASSKDLARLYAEEEPGVEVVPGEYSAKHWAEDARQTAVGSLTYRGSWDASTGQYPANPETGFYYKVSADGDFDGREYRTNDSIIYNGTGWDHIDNTEKVVSVGGYVGAITAGQLLAAIKQVDGSGSGLDADTVRGDAPTVFLRKDTPSQTITGGGNPSLTLLSDDDGEAVLNLTGSNQGTGRLFLGQSSTYGGGLEYNGDGSPASLDNNIIDSVVFYRTNAGGRYWTAYYDIDSPVWHFRGIPQVDDLEVWHPYNDGPGSGMHADLLDNKHADDFLLKSNSLSDIASVSDARKNLGLRAYSENITHTGGSVTISAGDAVYHVVDLQADIDTFNLAAVFDCETMIVTFVQDGTGNRTVGWHYSIHWPFGDEIELSTTPGAIDMIQFTTTSGGATWRASLIGADYS